MSLRTVGLEKQSLIIWKQFITCSYGSH